MTLKLRHDSSGYLTCEHVSVFYLLMLNSGIMGAYTYVVRGGVFCNAQTANFLMLGISLGEGNFKHALFYFIPISAYVLGAIASEILPTPIKHYGLFRWDTWLVGFEALILFIIGFIPQQYQILLFRSLLTLLPQCSIIHSVKLRVFRWQQPSAPTIFARLELALQS